MKINIRIILEIRTSLDSPVLKGNGVKRSGIFELNPSS
jgi:hypothetical protein